MEAEYSSYLQRLLPAEVSGGQAPNLTKQARQRSIRRHEYNLPAATEKFLHRSVRLSSNASNLPSFLLPSVFRRLTQRLS